MELGLAGKTALVTAASRGFGRAVAMELAAEGARVAMCARGEDDLQDAKAQVQAAGSGRHQGDDWLLAAAADVTDDAAVTELLARTEAELGPPDLLLVNGGGPPAGGFGELDLAAWEAAYRLNIESAVRLCRLVLPGMIERRAGRVVMVTSVSVKQPVENLVLSSVLRPAVQALTRNLAVECGDSGVTVNAVAPGFHNTSAVQRLIQKKVELTGCTADEVIAGWTAEIPQGRLGEPEELAALILFLMSERAGYITGQCIVSDGGWVKGNF